MSARQPLSERVKLPEALLSRTDLRDLGLERRAIDAVFRGAVSKGGVVVLHGYKRPLIRVATFNAVMEEATYRGDRVMPS